MHGFIFARCRICQSKLVYRKLENSSGLSLLSFSNTHRHPQAEIHESLKSEIRKLPDEIRASTALKILKKQVNVSRATFYRIFNSVKKANFIIPDDLYKMGGRQ